MQIPLTDLSRLGDLPFDQIIDVRSPSEYAEDHIPGAISLPVLDDAERARVGTIYVQESRFLARKIGAALVAANAARHLQGPLADREGDWRPLVYCWRGGQRSGSFASILSQVGWRAGLIEGGYRSYRRLVNDYLHKMPLPLRLILLDGNTGSAKTELLHLLAARGHQIVDLEGLAAHRGSIFGDMPHDPQPSQKGFETALAAALRPLDPARPVIVEAESSRIGTIAMPPSLWNAMRAAPRVAVAAPLAARAAYLTRAYGDLSADPGRLAAAIDGLRPFQSEETIAAWRAMARTGVYQQLAHDLMQRHYDPRYAKSTSRMGAAPVATASFSALTPQGLADGLTGLEDALAVAAAALPLSPRPRAMADPS
ncbi:tRNA 2-selenouridine(34) synthase MnmH [Brevirhabdus sp.]|uniref:tRNA 2-selenouridine(34) synthase MnmH n=1 Tax=Brevirhabdus sp. TaxID=2004514 RepID=UPI00405817D8